MSFPVAPTEDLVPLLRRAQAGSEEVAQRVYDRCREPLLAVIRKVITRPMRRLNDSDDFLFATFRVIFTRHFRDEVLRRPETLLPYLKRIAENQVRDAERRRLAADKHRCGPDIPLHFLREDELPVGREASPPDELIFRELVKERLDDLIEQLPILLQNILDLLLEGYNGVEIGMKLGVHPKRVYRAIAWLKRKVQEG